MAAIVLVILSMVGGNPTIIGGFTSMATCQAAVEQVNEFGDSHLEKCMEIK